MFNIFLRGHFFTKKFFTFLIGSTYLTTRIKKDYNPVSNKITNPEIKEDKFDKSIATHININILPFYKNPQSENFDIDYKYLMSKISLSIENLFFMMTLYKRNSILNCEEEKIRKPYLGCSIRANEEGKGMKIVMIKSESPAAMSGLQVKDVILEINGKSINTINDYNAAVGYEADVKKIKISRKENSEEKIIELNIQFIFSQ